MHNKFPGSMTPAGRLKRPCTAEAHTVHSESRMHGQLKPHSQFGNCSRESRILTVSRLPNVTGFTLDNGSIRPIAMSMALQFVCTDSSSSRQLYSNVKSFLILWHLQAVLITGQKPPAQLQHLICHLTDYRVNKYITHLAMLWCQLSLPRKLT